MKLPNLTNTLASLSLVISLALLLPMVVLAQQTTNCYNYSNVGGCLSNISCIPGGYTTTNWCKQLCAPFTDTGCCEYMQTIQTWGQTSDGLGFCPCTVTTTNTGAANLFDGECLWSGMPVPCNLDMQDGLCALPNQGS